MFRLVGRTSTPFASIAQVPVTFVFCSIHAHAPPPPLPAAALSSPLQLGILIENMRREGYEFCVSPPRVLTTEDDEGNKLEPVEEVHDVHTMRFHFYASFHPLECLVRW